MVSENEFRLSLNKILYILFYAPELESNTVYEKFLSHLAKTESQEAIILIYETLVSAINDNSYDYSNHLPGIRYSNEEILEFFSRLKIEMENDDEILLLIKSKQKLKI